MIDSPSLVAELEKRVDGIEDTSNQETVPENFEAKMKNGIVLKQSFATLDLLWQNVPLIAKVLVLTSLLDAMIVIYT